MSDRVAVVIPAYQSATTIESVVREIVAVMPFVTVIVVDDGSTDGTGAEAGRATTEVLFHEENRGVGAALKSGFRRALELDAEIIVTIGADKQRDPNEIPVLVDALRENDVDCVVGSKYLRKQSVPGHRKAGAALLGMLFNLLYRRRETDILSGFRAIWSRCLVDVDFLHDRYPFDADLRIHFVRRGFKTLEIPATVYYHEDSTRMRSTLSVGLHIASLIIRRRFKPADSRS